MIKMTTNRKKLAYIFWVMLNIYIFLNSNLPFISDRSFYPFAELLERGFGWWLFDRWALYNSYDYTEFIIYCSLPLVIGYVKKLIKEDKEK